MNNKTIPDFVSEQFLQEHILDIFNFYHLRCIDSGGGYYHYFLDDGTVYNRRSRHLVSSTRFIVNYAQWFRLYKQPELFKAMEHGIEYLRKHHRNSKTGGYVWELNGEQRSDTTNHCYGLAFVLLAYANAYRAGLNKAHDYLIETFDLMEQHFWEPEAGLYQDEKDKNWNKISNYRGQNANMHSCEALIGAYEATQNDHYLKRALMIADNICNRQTQTTQGLIWEHYNQSWQIDWDYNRNDPKHLFRPWGFQAGHQTEWAKLLLQLHQYIPQKWMIDKARFLFDSAIEVSWDTDNGGIFYGFNPQKHICDYDKYFWVQAESIAAAARLAIVTGDNKYLNWYKKIWEYSWAYFVDHKYGAWYRILDKRNQKYSNEKSPAGKTDYHTLGACIDILASRLPKK